LNAWVKSVSVSSFHVGCNSCYWQIMFIVPEKINESALKRRGFQPFFVLIKQESITLHYFPLPYLK
ncbi:MAG: hypothetical protein WBG70_17795, partial [Spirulinaceae cyanobacterium]